MRISTWKKRRLALYKRKFSIQEDPDVQLLAAMIDLEADLLLTRRMLKRASNRETISSPDIIKRLTYLTDQIYILQNRLGISRKERLRKEEEVAGSSIADLSVQLDDFINKNPGILTKWQQEENKLLAKLQTGESHNERRSFYETKLKEEDIMSLVPSSVKNI